MARHSARLLVRPARLAGETLTADSARRRRNWRIFAAGLGVRLLGVALLWYGDGGQTIWRKGLVVVGVVLSVGGIAVLRFLLLSGPLSRLTARRSAMR